MTRKSSSRASEQLRDISARYECPFPIFTTDEGEKFKKLSNRNILKPHHFSSQFMTHREHRPLFESQVVENIEFLEGTKMATFQGPAYHELMLEFYTTFESVSFRRYKCRLGGKEVIMDEEWLLDLLGITYEGVDLEWNNVPDEFGEMWFWKEISDDAPMSYGRFPASRIKDDALFFTYKFIGHVIFGKGEVNKMTSLELLVLWCANKKIKPSLPNQIFLDMATLQTEERFKLGFGNLITAMADHAGVDPSKGGTYTKIESCLVPVVPRTGKTFRARKSVSKRLRLEEGDSPRADEREGRSDEIPREFSTWMKSTEERIEGLIIANNARERDDANFRQHVMQRFDSAKKRQARHREEDRKEHKSIMDLIKSCFCPSGNAKRGDNQADYGGSSRDMDEGTRGGEREVRGDANPGDEAAENQGAMQVYERRKSTRKARDEGVSGDVHMRSTEYDHLQNFARFNMPSSSLEFPYEAGRSDQGAVVAYEGNTPGYQDSTAIYEAFNAIRSAGTTEEEELNSGDDEDQDDDDE